LVDHLEFGAAGEDRAARYLIGLGWKSLGRNIRNGRGELDIIAMAGGELVIVEVRSRRIGVIAPPETTVGPRKIRQIVKTARKYVGKIAYGGNWRVDVVAVTEDRTGRFDVELFSNVTDGMEGGFMG
jgi:putative endonuclease